MLAVGVVVTNRGVTIFTDVEGNHRPKTGSNLSAKGLVSATHTLILPEIIDELGYQPRDGAAITTVRAPGPGR